MSKRLKGQIARDTVSALVEAIEALVEQGSVRPDDAYALLQRTIKHLPERDQMALLPAIANKKILKLPNDMLANSGLTLQ